MSVFFRPLLYVLIFIFEVFLGARCIKWAINEYRSKDYFLGSVDAMLALSAIFILAEMIFKT